MINHIDHIENHFLAANLYFTGKFPLWGFVRPQSDYQLCTGVLGDKYQGENEAIHTDLGSPVFFNDYFTLFNQAGPVHNAARPPLYPLLLSLVYLLFGFKVVFAYTTHLVLLAAIPSMAIAFAFYQSGLKGTVAAIIAGLLFMQFNPFTPYEMTPDLLAVLIMVVVFFTIRWAIQLKQAKAFVFPGVCMALLLLTKGSTLLFFIVFSLVFLLLFWKKASARKGIISFFLTVVCVLLPWMLYINYVQHQTQDARKKWMEKFVQAFPYTSLQSANARDETVIPKSLLHLIYTNQLAERPFIFLTTQMYPAAFLYFHNPSSLSGGVGIIDALDTASAYNNMPSHWSVPQKIGSFYQKNPGMLQAIAAAKVREGLGLRGMSLLSWAAVIAAFLFLLQHLPIGMRRICCMLLAFLLGYTVFISSSFLFLFTLSLILPAIGFVFYRSFALSADYFIYSSIHYSSVIFTVLLIGNPVYTGIYLPVGLFVLCYGLLQLPSLLVDY